AHDKTKKVTTIMTTADMAMKMDPIYAKISKRFHENPQEFADAFARAWFKLTHRDLGPKSKYIGPEIPKEDLIWQDPIPAINYEIIDEKDIEILKEKLLSSSLGVSKLVSLAWASASTYRDSDKRGGANGARIALEPQRSWESNSYLNLDESLKILETIKDEFNSSNSNKKVSLADLIVLGGCAAVEKAAKDAGFSIKVPFTAGRADAAQEQTDVESFAYLEPMADGFRNYQKTKYTLSTEELLIDKAQLLTLTIPEMTALVGGMRVLGANYANSDLGVFTSNVGVLSNDFFVNLLDMKTAWYPTTQEEDSFVGKDRQSGSMKYSASRVDLLFGSNSQLRAVAEIYAQEDSKEKFVQDFINAWTKVMNLDRFDIQK
ncbi:catalase-peroxidase, partial [Aliarcobacter butzleri]